MQTRTTRDLTPHPKIKHLIGRWKADSDEMLALRRSIQEHGIMVPLLVTHDNYILDGVTRWQAAKALQLDTVPIEERPETEALDIVLATELHRRHQTKSVLAFRLAPMIVEAWNLARDRQNNGYQLAGNPAKSFRKSGDQPDTQDSPQTGTLFSATRTVAEYATSLGVSVRLLEQAHELHQLFHNHEKTEWTWLDRDLDEIGVTRGTKLSFRDYFTPWILERGMSLGGALTGLKTKLSLREMEAKRGPHTGGRPKKGEKDKQLRLITEAWEGVTNRWTYWNDLDNDEREHAALAIGTAIHGAPDDVLVAMRRGIDAEIKRRKEA
jgi:hypothetical protein